MVVTVFAVAAVGDHYLARNKRTAGTGNGAMTPGPLERTRQAGATRLETPRRRPPATASVGARWHLA